MNVFLETSPLKNAHAIRGVGVYTRFLSQELKKLENPYQKFFTSEDIGQQKIDVIHYPYFDLFQQTLPLSFSRTGFGNSEQKIVVTIHDVIPLLYPKYYPVGIRGKISFLLQKYILRSVAAIITDSETSKKDIHKYLDVPEKKILSIPLAGNPEIHKSSLAKVQEVKKRFNLPDKYVLYVGDINYNKNIPNLIKAMNEVNNEISLVCVGANFKPQNIPEWHRIESTLESIIGRVIFLTTIQKNDNEALSAIYSGAIAYIQPSLYEGFGLPLLEAMQAGTIVVSSDTAALKEIGGEGVIFSDTTSNTLAQAINIAVSLSEQERKKRIDLNNAIVKKFSWEKVATNTVEVYKSVL